MPRKPNFFILGAGKCGTTSLYAYLKQHPQIFMSPIKEPSFFCEHFRVVDNAIDYFALFDGVGKEPIIGEASHVYFSNPGSAKVLRTLFPDARFAVILRNPADRAYSLYHHMRRYGLEFVGSFESALAAEEKRFRSRRFRKTCPHYRYNYFYFRSGLFGEQVERYFKWFAPDRFFFLRLDQLRADPKGAVARLLEHLHLPGYAAMDFQRHNEGRLTRRWPKMQYLWQIRMLPMLKKYNRMQTAGRIMRLLDRINVTAVPPMNPETRKALVDRFAADQRKLRRLIGIDFL